MSKNERRVVVGLSGGVDSAVTAALLKEAGYEVIGSTLRLLPEEWYPGVDEHRLEVVRKVARTLKIELVEIDARRDFVEKVVRPFIEAYHKGLTPNPCAICNPRVKLHYLRILADQRDAQWIATGHYAQVTTSNDRFLLRRARDLRRDQSYFLFGLTQTDLSRLIFPLGEYSKDEVRARAQAIGLPNAGRKNSVDVCFVPGGDYRKLLKEHSIYQLQPGEVVDLEGKVLGRHEGIEFFTIGQRRGLGIAKGEPLYVVDIDPVQRRVIVGPEPALYSRLFYVVGCNWIAFERPPQEFRAMVKIRYSHSGVNSFVRILDTNSVLVELDEPQRAVTPGQVAVFYQDDIVLGGGWIMKRKNCLE